MKVDIQNIEKVWINLDEETERKDKMLEQFSEYNFENCYRMEGIKKDGNSVLGCGMSMYAAVLYAKTKLPCLVMEDDARIHPEFFKNEIEVPDDTDAIYLGISHWGMLEGGPASTLNGVGREPINNEITKINSMCSLHAVVYLTDRYVNATLHAIAERNQMNSNKEYTGNVGHVDIGTALIQKNFNVVAPISPYFYQDCPRNKIFTEVPLNYRIEM